LGFYARRSAHRDELLTYLGEQHDLHLLTEMRGNTGDQLIWSGTRDLLDSGQVPYSPTTLAEVGEAAYPRSTLLIPGSGAFDQRWHEWLPDTVCTAARGFEKIVILPSSFDPTVPVVAKCLARHNVHAFAREERSYRCIEGLTRASLSFDCAVYFHGFEDGGGAAALPAEDGPLLVALREDEGSRLSAQGLRPDPLLNRDISLRTTRLAEWLDAVSRAARVVTDRLHVAVAAVLLGRRLMYVDPYNAKISTYFSYAFGDAFSHLVTRHSLSWLVHSGFAVPVEPA
jgi:exopolysaccharide biosynthesis predicted pyruvyltransferase EpsI